MLEQKERFLQHRVDVEQVAHGLFWAAEVEHALDNTLAALHLVLDERKRFGERARQWRRRDAILAQRERERFGAGTDGGEWIVDLVHDARGECTDRRKFLRLSDSLLCLTPLGNVFPDRDDVGDVRVIEAHWNLRYAVGAKLTRRTRLDLKLLHLTGAKDILEFPSQNLGRLAMQNLEDRSTDRFLA